MRDCRGILLYRISEKIRFELFVARIAMFLGLLGAIEGSDAFRFARLLRL